MLGASCRVVTSPSAFSPFALTRAPGVPCVVRGKSTDHTRVPPLPPSPSASISSRAGRRCLRADDADDAPAPAAPAAVLPHTHAAPRFVVLDEACETT